MAITNITSFPNPYSPSTPATGCYAWAAGLGLDASRGTGSVVYNVHPSEADWTGTPLGQVRINLGDTIAPASADGKTPAVVMPTLAELLAISAPTLPANPTVGDLYAAMGKVIDSYAVHHPAFAGGAAS